MTELTLERVDLVRLAMRMRARFRTSFGTQQDRDIVLARVHCGGVEGYGELTAGEEPLYSEESVETALTCLRVHLLPRVLGATFAHPADVPRRWAAVRGNHMAKAAVETAVWDAWARARGMALSRALGGRPGRVPAGVSVGIHDDLGALLDDVGRFLEQGYARIKVKIEPGWDVGVVERLRDAFGDIPLMVDANSSYTLDDTDHLRRLDAYGLMMIEQPLDHDDIVDHATLQARLSTPICLDESIRSAAIARRALEIGACRVINAKVGRLGGHCESLALHELCASRGVDLWCGGMLESGVGRLHNIALASLPGFTLPGDTSASDRYWERDIVEPPVTIAADGTVAVPAGPGLGHALPPHRLRAVTVAEERHTPGRAPSGTRAG